MVTGVETAGIVLAIFPLIISALEHYRKGLEPFVIWAKYHRELGSLRRLLELEEAKLLNTCERLLEPIVSTADLAVLISEPGGNRWKDKELQSKLRRLLTTAHQSFLDALENINEELTELSAKLGVDLKGKPNWTNKDSLERALNRIKFSLSKEKRTELKNKLRKANKDLKELTGSSLELAPSRRKTLQMIYFERIRKDACSVHDVLELGPWHCTCPLPHNANLRLEARVSSEATPSGGGPITLPHRFRVLFSFTTEPTSKQLPVWNWHETDIVPLDEGDGRSSANAPRTAISDNVYVISTTLKATNANNIPTSPPRKKLKKRVQWVAPAQPTCSIPLQPSNPTPTLRQIQDLCATLQMVREGLPCLGFLVDAHKRRHVIYPIRKHPRALASQDTVSLENLLSVPTPMTAVSAPPIQAHLSRRDRLYLAFILASTVLQLHTTPWLNERWGKSDILFLRQLGGSRSPLTEQPYISKPFASSVITRPSCKNKALCSTGPMIRNKSIFDLGILLIELCFNKSLEQLREPEDLNNGKPNAYTDFSTANRLIQSVYNEAGNRYGDAVRRCIRCDFDQREETFESNEFRQAVYHRVVAPLEDDLRDFCGGKLPRPS